MTSCASVSDADARERMRTKLRLKTIDSAVPFTTLLRLPLGPVI